MLLYSADSCTAVTYARSSFQTAILEDESTRSRDERQKSPPSWGRVPQASPRPAPTSSPTKHSHVFAGDLPALDLLGVLVQLPGHPGPKRALGQGVIDIEDVVFLKAQLMLHLRQPVVQGPVPGDEGEDQEPQPRQPGPGVRSPL